MIYFAVLILLIILSFRYDFRRELENKDFWFNVVIVVMVLIAGLRYRLGGDTINYLRFFYHEIPSLDSAYWSEFYMGAYEPLYVLLNAFVKYIGCKFFIVQLICASITNSLILLYFKKHSEYPFACAIVFFVWSFFFLNFEELRAGISVAICLYANDFIVKKQFLRGIVLVVVSGLFHYSSIVLIITPLLLNLRFNKVGILFLLTVFVSGVIIKNQLESFMMSLDFLGDRISGRGARYFGKEAGEHNIFYYIFDIGVLFFYSLFSFKYIKRLKIDSSIRYIEPFIMIGLSFVMLKSNILIISRYVRFYEPYFIILFTYCFFEMIKRSKQLSIGISCMRSLLFFVPFFYTITSYYKNQVLESIDIVKHYNYEKYYPYASVIEKSIDERREKCYNSIGGDKMIKNEY